jgi:hypothetical protein
MANLKSQNMESAICDLKFRALARTRYSRFAPRSLINCGKRRPMPLSMSNLAVQAFPPEISSPERGNFTQIQESTGGGLGTRGRGIAYGLIDFDRLIVRLDRCRKKMGAVVLGYEIEKRHIRRVTRGSN